MCHPYINRLFRSYDITFTFLSPTFTFFHFHFQHWGEGVACPPTGCFIISIHFHFNSFYFHFHFCRLSTNRFFLIILFHFLSLSLSLFPLSHLGKRRHPYTNRLFYNINFTSTFTITFLTFTFFHFHYWGKGVAHPPTGCFTHIISLSIPSVSNFHFLPLSLSILGKGEHCFPCNRFFKLTF